MGILRQPILSPQRSVYFIPRLAISGHDVRLVSVNFAVGFFLFFFFLLGVGQVDVLRKTVQGVS